VAAGRQGATDLAPEAAVADGGEGPV
jgi:hypothetical protein